MTQAVDADRWDEELRRTEEASRRARLISQQVGRPIAQAPAELPHLRTHIRAEEYEVEGGRVASRLTELVERQRHPLARAILYAEVIGPPVSFKDMVLPPRDR